MFMLGFSGAYHNPARSMFCLENLQQPIVITSSTGADPGFAEGGGLKKKKGCAREARGIF